MHWHDWKGSSLLLQLTLQPSAKRDEFVGLHGDALKVRVHAPRLEGRANRELIEFLADAFATPRARVSLVRGVRTRRKTVSIDRPERIPPALQASRLRAPSDESRK